MGAQNNIEVRVENLLVRFTTSPPVDLEEALYIGQFFVVEKAQISPDGLQEIEPFEKAVFLIFINLDIPAHHG